MNIESYKEFLDFLKSIDVKISPDYKINEAMEYGDLKELHGVDYIGNCYVVGGAEGGNCWGDEAEGFYNTPSSEDVSYVESQLDYLLTKLCPDITFLQYKNIAKLIREDEFCDYQWYGNRDDYQVKYIKVKELYEVLKSMGII